MQRLCALLQNSGIRCRVLYLDGDKLTVLLYNPAMLAIYMRNKRATTILMGNGYEQFDLESILLEFGRRYRSYRTESKSFPHELGLLLGYPLDDVEGFIKNDGRIVYIRDIGKCTPMLSKEICFAGLSVPEKNS
ncbi:MAG: DUF3793 family protein [Clostridium sp.]